MVGKTACEIWGHWWNYHGQRNIHWSRSSSCHFLSWVSDPLHTTSIAMSQTDCVTDISQSDFFKFVRWRHGIRPQNVVHVVNRYFCGVWVDWEAILSLVSMKFEGPSKFEYIDGQIKICGNYAVESTLGSPSRKSKIQGVGTLWRCLINSLFSVIKEVLSCSCS